MRSPMILCAICLMFGAADLAAQERRRSAGGPGPEAGPPAAMPSLPRIAYDAARPWAGVWEGEFRPAGGAPAPLIVVIEFVNGGYAGYQFLAGATTPAPHRVLRQSGDTLHWEMPNSGGGTLVYSGRLTGTHAVQGVLNFRDLPFPRTGDGQATFVLRRRSASR